MTNYDDFFKSCKPKMESIRADKHLGDADLLCACPYFFYFKNIDTIILTDHNGGSLTTQPLPVDLPLFINRKVIEFYEDQASILKRLLWQEHSVVAVREKTFTRNWSGLFSKIIKELYNGGWDEKMWSVTVQNKDVLLRADFGAHLLIPKTWFSKEEEEVDTILCLCKRIFALRQHRDVNSEFTLPKTMDEAWAELQYGQENIYNNLIPEIHRWVSDDGVPHVVVPGMTVCGEKGDSFHKVFYTTALFVAAGMPYHNVNHQRRMIDVLIRLCRSNDEVVLDQVVGRIGPVPLRQEVEKALQAMTYHSSKG